MHATLSSAGKRSESGSTSLHFIAGSAPRRSSHGSSCALFSRCTRAPRRRSGASGGERACTQRRD